METAVRAVDNYEAKKKFIQWMEILPSPRFLQ